ncbi:MAG TPA: DUF3108 domain-containing protein [Longimicrobiaceae bacterium]|nr:DUF3108 domain-containing protein [Longimicrobiaceae bacterium]
MRAMILCAAATLAATGGRAQTAEPTPTPDAARVWRGTVTYRVSFNGDTTGTDTAELRVDGGHFVAVDRMHLMGMARVAETRMALPALAPVASTGTVEAGSQHGEVRLAYAGGRVRGIWAMPGTPAGDVDAEVPAGTFDFGGVATVIMAMPLRAGAVWTLPAYSPYVRGVSPYRVEVGAVEAVETPMGPVRAYPVRVTGGPAEMLFWFSEAEPRWEVKGQVPSMGVTIEARSRTP